ncbi:disks large-associated protein 5 [Lampris incognitus]|uniref:disks large-associated protein 5 n=1 Tax=Lampris incognitus TaxID=2546036 RepID=UPI0024B50A42|nr:disks large-associated protein 5 [Lampris incognitus]
MDSRFAQLRQRDSSVSMLRVKLSRRRSLSQKENRERALNSRRQLDKLVELDCSVQDTSVMMVHMPTIQETQPNIVKKSKNEAVIERMKQLERWKERKVLEKEKARREKECRGVFKVGLYRPENSFSLSLLPPVQTSIINETIQKTHESQSGRVTRSMKQQQKLLKENQQGPSVRKVESAVGRTTRSQVAVMNSSKVPAAGAVERILSARSVNRPLTAAPPQAKVKPASDARATRTRANAKPGVPLTGRGRNCKVSNDRNPPAISKDAEKKAGPISSSVKEVKDQAPSDSIPHMGSDEAQPSFAPQGFMFQAPVGLSSFKFDPLTPRSADAFLTPSSSFSLPPVFDPEPEAMLKSPSPARAPAAPLNLSEPQHDVPYFRSEMNKETERLLGLCDLWGAKLDDESIPEEMQDRMRTAIGQARLLMKERFAQFSGLTDDCELGRGEKITTCTDLQGFWDMVYFQVEDVNKKFDALKEAESRGWLEEHKAPPLPKKRAVKKQPSCGAAKPAGTNAAAKSRLAAFKASMKARQQAAELQKAAEENTQSDREIDTVVFHGGFFQVESPAKPAGFVKTASHHTAAVLHGTSPGLSLTNTTPGRATRHSITSHVSPARPSLTPTCLSVNLGQSPRPRARRQLSPPQRPNSVNVSVSFSPIMDVPSDGTRPDQSEPVSRPDEVSSAACDRDNNEAESVLVLAPSLVPSPAVHDQNGPAEDRNASLSLSPRSPSPSCRVTEPPLALSFTRSPYSACMMPARQETTYASLPLVSSPAAISVPMETRESTSEPPDRDDPGFDFERYLQPSEIDSLSSPMMADIEMESPRSPPINSLTQEEAVMIATVVPAVSTLSTPHTPQTQADLSLFTFTPDLRDRIRQSVCPRDLMVFTPPSDVFQGE